jgi:hypothetical protein
LDQYFNLNNDKKEEVSFKIVSKGAAAVKQDSELQRKKKKKMNYDSDDSSDEWKE